MPSKSYFIKKNNSGYINNIISKFYKKIYLIGDWQDKKFNLQEYINIISHLKLKKEIKDKFINQSWVKKIQYQNSVAVCVRRSDYVKFGSNSNREYFEKSINFFNINLKKAKFFFFSDDIEWCKKNFSNYSNAFFVCKNENVPFENILLISQCKHAIISKSTFDWWGSMLIKNKNKLIIVDGSWKLNSFKGIHELNELEK